MIPKIIHYIWGGGAPMPEKLKENIETWRKYCPDYEIKEWNEHNFDLDLYKYAREAHEKKKWGLGSDPIRLWALYNYGGIYLDTDVEIKRNMDDLLSNDFVLGFESQFLIGSAFMAAEKGNKVIGGLLGTYNDRALLRPDGSINWATLPQNLTLYMLDYLKKRKLTDGHYNFQDGIRIYPKEYFFPKDSGGGEFAFTENTYAIHQVMSSWTERNLKGSKFMFRARLFFANRFWRVFGCDWSIRKLARAYDKAFGTRSNLWKKKK